MAVRRHHGHGATVSRAAGPGCGSGRAGGAETARVVAGPVGAQLRWRPSLPLTCSGVPLRRCPGLFDIFGRRARVGAEASSTCFGGRA